MLLRELFLRETAPEQLGRAFNHPEHFVIFHGVSGILEALQHFEEMAGEPNGQGSVRIKWDGNPQIYWGREVKGGPLVLAGHNGWGKGGRNTGTDMNDFTSPKAIHNFIVNKSGNPKTPEEVAERKRFATEFANLYPIFDAATPKDFVGFVYADALFLPSTKPKLDSARVYNMHPNPKSDTEYHISHDSALGKRMAQAQVMVVGHGMFKYFGAPDAEQIPKENFEEFNGTPALIVQGPVYNTETPKADMAPIQELKAAKGYLEKYSKVIDSFVANIPRTDKTGIFYPFLNQQNAAGHFDHVNTGLFYAWMEQSNPTTGKPRVSVNKQNHIKQLNAQSNALDHIWHVMKIIRKVKHDVIDKLDKMPKPDVWATNGEGYVRYAQPHHKHGNIKLVSPGWKR